MKTSNFTYDAYVLQLRVFLKPTRLQDNMVTTLPTCWIVTFIEFHYSSKDITHVPGP